jgi:hypothetical protein
MLLLGHVPSQVHVQIDMCTAAVKYLPTCNEWKPMPTHLCHNCSGVHLLQGPKHCFCCLGGGRTVVNAEARQACMEGTAVGHLPTPQVGIFHVPATTQCSKSAGRGWTSMRRAPKH